MSGIEKQAMIDSGYVREERAYEDHKSRGWYICDGGIHYLHNDGTIENGISTENPESGFWDSEAEAQTFLDQWREAQ